MEYPASNGTIKDDGSNVKWKLDVTDFGKSQTYSVYTWLRSIFVYIIPLLLLCIFNFYLVKFVRTANSRWRQSKRNRIPHNYSPDAQPETTDLKMKNRVISAASFRRNERRQAAQRKLTILPIAIAGIFIAGQIPQALAYASNYQIVLRLFGKCSISLGCCLPYRIYRAVTNCICLITYSANFFLYATLNSHFKNELIKYFSMCSLKKRITFKTQCLNTSRFGSNRCEEKPEEHVDAREALSAEAFQVKKRRKPREIPLSECEMVPATETNNLQTYFVPRSYSDHVWRVSIAVLPETGGRPVALANATMGRTVNTTHSDSILSPGSVKSPRKSPSSQLKFPSNDSLFSSDSLCLNSILQFSGHVHTQDSTFNTQPLLNQAKDDLLAAPNEKILIRVHSHSKRFWSKRRHLLAETKNREEKKKIMALLERQVLTENQFQLHVISQRLQNANAKGRDQNHLQFLLPSYPANTPWCPPFIVASLLRANHDIAQRDIVRVNLHNFIPSAYHETHLDNVL
ncbi:unnamed protein product [Hymenolepis diminuta]|uniref:G_PROTEIN_RECEP_F1_2 domain-containing protein n=1 Tax=Hymenolepis diminuta TaxID=6216 RepID=A0A0R3SWW4_HYMDI|nr:unnamed protein product [Hymenolepis diminuta]VUZ55849.1 unnamed protein product [Hymenolepis diminuta]